MLAALLLYELLPVLEDQKLTLGPIQSNWAT